MNVISKTLDPYFLYGMALDVIGVLLVVYVVVGGTEELLSKKAKAILVGQKVSEGRRYLRKSPEI